jgi:kumamolisin
MRRTQSSRDRKLLSADPFIGVLIIVHGIMMAVGGTSVSVPLWAGLIARIDQALGYNVGYLNPRLYRDIGPEGVLRAVAIDDKGVSQVNDSSLRRGWSPVAGWGSPDGTKLLNWLRAHPNPSNENKIAALPCRQK